MEFAHPAWLTALAAVAAVAILSRLCRGRKQRVVASLSLWRQALGAVARKSVSVRRKSALAWWLLLAGAALAALALAGPRVRTLRQVRSVALEIRAGAEMSSPESIGAAREAGTRLLRRLSQQDRVQLVLPVSLGRESSWLTASEAGEILLRFRASSVPAGRLTMPPILPEVRKTIVLDCGEEDLGGPGRERIAMPCQVPPVRVEAFSGRVESDGVRLLIRIQNDAAEPFSGQVVLRAYGTDREPALVRIPLTAGPGRSASHLVRVPRAQAYSVLIDGLDAQAPGAFSALALTEAREVKVALVGPPESSLQQLVSAGEGLVQVARASEADVVLAYKEPLGPEDSGISILPPRPPQGYLSGATIEDALLQNASLTVDDPLLDAVDLAPVGVVRLETWRPGGPGNATALGRLEEGIFLLKRDRSPRRLWLSFDIARANTNFTREPAFVVLLANAIDWLAPARRKDVLTSQPAPETLVPDNWQKVAGPAGAPAGLYRGPGGDYRAVTWPRLRPNPSRSDWQERLASVRWPEPETRVHVVSLGPWLLAAALVFWTVGWWLRRL